MTQLDAGLVTLASFPLETVTLTSLGTYREATIRMLAQRFLPSARPPTTATLRNTNTSDLHLRKISSDKSCKVTSKETGICAA